MRYLRDLVWLAAIGSTAAGIGMIYVPAALIFLGLCLGAAAYWSHPR